MNKLEIENKLKDNKLPEGWKSVRLGEVLKYEQPYKYIVKNTQYEETGIPVLTAGKTFILGFTVEEDGIYTNLPVIIFDDFTTESKYIDFPFKVKSSAMKFLKKKDNNIVLKFVFENMQLFRFPSLGGDHKRRWISEFQYFQVPLPPLTEQQKIAEILETIDETIEKTDEIIEKYKRIKQGLMQDLLTEGITAFEFEKDKLIHAVKKAFENGDHRFGREENLVSHLSRHLDEFFPGWDVDSEVEKNNERQRPDIIIHKRGTDKNLFAIEVKKNYNLNAIKEDIKKLEDVMLGDYQYEDAVFIGFNIESFEDIFKLSEKVNFILVSKNGEIKVKSRVRRFKDSLLGRIPEEWEVVELMENISVLLSNVDKKIFNFEQKVLLCNYLDVYKNEYINNSISFMRGSANRREIKKFGVSKGNVIITKDSEEFNDIAKSAYVRDEINNLICGYHLALLKSSKRIDGLYLSIMLKLYKVNSFFQRRANGITRFGITKETIEKALIFLPTLPEQKRIASILSQIDKTIEKEQNYKEKLKRIKQGLMQDLLTGKVRVNHLIREGVESV